MTTAYNTWMFADDTYITTAHEGISQLNAF